MSRKTKIIIALAMIASTIAYFIPHLSPFTPLFSVAINISWLVES